MIRDYIAEHGDEFGEIIHFPEFQKYFEVQGTSLKNVPAGYELEHPQAEYLKFKNWYLKYPVADEVLNDSEAFKGAASGHYMGLIALWKLHSDA